MNKPFTTAGIIFRETGTELICTPNSILRRIKTWLRQQSSESRHSMLSIHKQKNADNEENFIAQVIDKGLYPVWVPAE